MREKTIEMNKALNPATATSGSSGTLSGSGYDMLRDDIIHGRFEPGAKLRIDELKRRYGMGATPLREALNRLSAEGFVIAKGQRGFCVADISIEDLEDITNLRVVLEALALTKSIQKGDDNWEAQIVAAYHRLTKIETQNKPDISEWESRNRDFHLALISACTSKWLNRFYSTLYDQHKRYRNIARVMTPSGPRDAHREHEEIYKATLDRDIERACEANEKHIRRTAAITGRVLQEDGLQS